MRKQLWAFIFITVFLVVGHPATAQDNLAQFENRLNGLNQTQITLSPRYKTDFEVFAMRVLDSNRQLVGRVEDIKLDDSGAMVGLVSEINNVGRKNRTVENEVFEVVTYQGITNSFEIPLGFDATEDTSPEVLAAIAPAAGGQGSILSLRAMIDADVRNDGGRWLGKVKNIVFDNEARRIEAIVIDDVPGARRYQEIALPFDPEQVKVVSDYGRIEFRVEAAAAKLVTDFAKENR